MDVSALTRKAASQGAASYRDVGLIDPETKDRPATRSRARVGSARTDELISGLLGSRTSRLGYPWITRALPSRSQARPT